MSRVDVPSDSFCVDQTEVTREQYERFLADAPAFTSETLPEACRAVADHAPSAECASSTDLCVGDGCGRYPQTCIGFCDAAAFCAWSGKELCGDIGGGYGVRTVDEQVGGRWTAACGNGLDAEGGPSQKFAYGSAYSAARCNTETGTVAEVASYPQCEAASAESVFDLSGNVAEFTGVLRQSGEGGELRATARGTAGFGFNAGNGTCDALIDVPLDYRLPEVGFRCCKSVQ